MSNTNKGVFSFQPSILGLMGNHFCPREMVREMARAVQHADQALEDIQEFRDVEHLVDAVANQMRAVTGALQREVHDNVRGEVLTQVVLYRAFMESVQRMHGYIDVADDQGPLPEDPIHPMGLVAYARAFWELQQGQMISNVVDVTGGVYDDVVAKTLEMLENFPDTSRLIDLAEAFAASRADDEDADDTPVIVEPEYTTEQILELIRGAMDDFEENGPKQELKRLVKIIRMMAEIAPPGEEGKVHEAAQNLLNKMRGLKKADKPEPVVEPEREGPSQEEVRRVHDLIERLASALGTDPEDADVSLGVTRADKVEDAADQIIKQITDAGGKITPTQRAELIKHLDTKGKGAIGAEVLTDGTVRLALL